MKEPILAVAIGFFAGIAGGLFGIGGGIVIVPALIATLGFTQIKAQGTSLVALLAPVGIFALAEYYKKGETDLRLGGMLACGFLVGGFLGARFALGLGEEAMRKGFAIFLAVIAVWLFFRP